MWTAFSSSSRMAIRAAVVIKNQGGIDLCSQWACLTCLVADFLLRQAIGVLAKVLHIASFMLEIRYWEQYS